MREYITVNSLMLNFVDINACVFEPKPCLQGLIFAVSSGLVNYLGAWQHELCFWVFFRHLKMVVNFAK